MGGHAGRGGDPDSGAGVGARVRRFMPDQDRMQPMSPEGLSRLLAGWSRGISDIDTVWGVYDTGHDPSGSVTVCADGTGGTVGRFERTTRARGESVADGAFRSRRTPALGPPRERARHATGQVPAVGGVTR